MIADVEHLKRMISNALGDALRRPDGGHHNIDAEVAKKTIIAYVLPEKIEANDANRYELYYSLLGKSVAIAQGWKINCADDLVNPGETADNLRKYIEQTYGAWGA